MCRHTNIHREYFLIQVDTTHTHTPSIIEIDLGQLERREKELSVKQMLQETEHKLVELKHMEDKVHPRHTYPVIPKHT